MTGLIRLIVLGLVLTAFAPSADAMTWPRAVALAHAVIYQHNTNAFRQLQDASRQGDSAAQTALGMMYQYGKGVTPNLPLAVHWFKLAARQGYARAQDNLGNMYATGKGVTSNLPRAVHWTKLAARQGFARAQDNLGVMYATGQGVTPNLPRAVYWYQLAARQGFAQAQYNLGMMYQYGQGVTPNLPRAVHWYQLAARQGIAQAQYSLGFIYATGKGVTPNLPRAVYWFQLAARQGYKPAIKGLRVLQQLQRTAHARSLQSPAAPAPAGAQRASTAFPVHDQQQSVRNLQRFWTLYFQAAHARLVDFGAPALVQPVSFAAAHP